MHRVVRCSHTHGAARGYKTQREPLRSPSGADRLSARADSLSQRELLGGGACGLMDGAGRAARGPDTRGAAGDACRSFAVEELPWLAAPSITGPGGRPSFSQASVEERR